MKEQCRICNTQLTDKNQYRTDKKTNKICKACKKKKYSRQMFIYNAF